MAAIRNKRAAGIQAAAAPSRSARRGRLRLLALLLGTALAAALGGACWLLAASLARHDGRLSLPGLEAPVTVARDDLGVPILRGSSRRDLALALGFVHAQERFFQMDLLRRRGAGELAELLGDALLDLDRRVRLHRFRHRAGLGLAALPDDHRALLTAYADGVNAGLADLRARPFEYLLLGAEPAPWRPEDTALVIYAMYLDLQDNAIGLEADLGLMEDLLPPSLFAFLAPRGTSWDTPLTGPALPAPPLPRPGEVELAATPPPAGGALPLPAPGPPSPGSNNWAVAGRHSGHGGALLANDMHLGHGIPTIWYRAMLVWPDGQGREWRVSGVTLPGAPAVVAGSNGRVAWGFTNAEGDWSDLVILEPDGRGGYLTGDGPRPFQRDLETIRTRDGAVHRLEVLSTVWGPVLDRDHRGRQRALRWVAHDPQGLNLELLGLETAAGVEQALDIAARSGAPAQNLVAADADGRIGWTVTGPIPLRRGLDGRTPRSWADGAAAWDGWLGPDRRPRLIDPPDGRLWSANNRLVGGADLERLGFGNYDLGARARQIRDGLRALHRPLEADMLALQLDDRALFLGRWRRLLLAILDERALAAAPRRAELRRQVAYWGGRAAVDSAGYRLVREFRDRVAHTALQALTAPCRAADPRFDYGRFRYAEGPLWALVTARPAHLLDPRYGDWQELLLAAVDDLTAQAGASRPLAGYTWGERNTVRIRHPFSRVLPLLGAWLDPAPLPLPGDTHMPRVQAPGWGASQRMAVSPGREHLGYFHMPGGQSGHPLSPHYLDGLGAWAQGEPTPFLPGPTRHRLVLSPP